MASVEELSNVYFKSMNTLAEKISSDISSTQEAYQDLWHKLSEKEQKQVLDEAIIEPAAVLKYNKFSESSSDWRERSTSDFSWFTKSQLNLFTVNSLKGEKVKSPTKKSEELLLRSDTSGENKVRAQNDCNLLNKLKNKVPILKTTSLSEEKQSLVESRSQLNINPKIAISKPKTPPPPPPSKQFNIHTEKRALLSNDNESDHSEDIPKTGFDFLDNW